jgi:hypothetical protein
MYSAGESKSASPIFVTSRLVHHISPSFHLSRIRGYWARGGQIRNLCEIDDRLFFRDRVPDSMRGGLQGQEGP